MSASFDLHNGKQALGFSSIRQLSNPYVYGVYMERLRVGDVFQRVQVWIDSFSEFCMLKVALLKRDKGQ